MNWDAVGAITSVSIAFGAMLMVWWRFSKDNAEIRRDVERQAKEIAAMMVDKANCKDVLKLAQMIEALEKNVLNHHLDYALHRNKDFEARMDTLATKLETFAKENKEDHLSIVDLIGKVTK